MTIAQWNAHQESDDANDRQIEEYQTQLGQREDNFIIDGRLSWYAIPHSLKVFLTVDPDEGARRIFTHAQEGGRAHEDAYTSAQEVREANATRIASENKRYMEYYGVTYDNEENFDLVVDTTTTPPDAVLAQILAAMAEKQA